MEGYVKEIVERFFAEERKRKEELFKLMEERESLEDKKEYLRLNKKTVAFPVLSNKERIYEKVKQYMEPMGYGEEEVFGVFLGVCKEISPLGELIEYFLSEDVEEIYVNGPGKEVIVKTIVGLKKTGISYGEREIKVLGAILGKEKVFVDDILPDGSRVNFVSKEVAPKGPILTFRKFKQNPLNMADLVKEGFLSVDAAAYLWLMSEGMGKRPMNILIAGGTSTGKTTFLNAILMMLPKEERIITIEDTLEINLSGRENWVQLKTNEDIGAELLIKNALRMNPNRVVVGEVRYKEAFNLLSAMNIGHYGSMGTIHANSSRDAINRLTFPPMNVPLEMVASLNVIVSLKKERDKRKLGEVTEVFRADDKVVMQNVFELEDGELSRTRTPFGLFDMFQQYGLEKKEVMEEYENRKKVVSFVVNNGLESNFLDFVMNYYSNPQEVIALIENEQ